MAGEGSKKGWKLSPTGRNTELNLKTTALHQGLKAQSKVYKPLWAKFPHCAQ